MRNCTLCLIFTALLLSSCGRIFVPRIPKDVEPLVVSNCVLPAQGSELFATMDWNNVLHGTPWEGHAPVEVFPLENDAGANVITMYCGSYNWNKGQVQEERKPSNLDPNKTYVIMEVDGLISIVTYLMKHVWNKFVEFIA